MILWKNEVDEYSEKRTLPYKKEILKFFRNYLKDGQLYS